MGSLDQIVAHRSPGSPGRSRYPVLAAEYPGPGETELWVSVRTHTSASMRSSQPTILAVRAVSFCSTRARFHVAIFIRTWAPSHFPFSIRSARYRSLDARWARSRPIREGPGGSAMALHIQTAAQPAVGTHIALFRRSPDTLIHAQLAASDPYRSWLLTTTSIQ